MELIPIAAGQVIFHQGDLADYAYVIKEGTVEIYNEHDDGEETHLAMLGAGEMFGELGIIDDKPRSASARAVGDVVLQIVPI